jgi:ubiquinone/menaquinone biosynthesis C-methylase UbiE
MRNYLRNFIARQFGHPRGPVGRFVGRRLADGNVYDAGWTISLLNIQPSSRVLEIGFGPGVSTGMAAERAVNGFVAGVDRSALMVQVASTRNAAAIKAGRMEVREGDVAALPYPDESFDIAFSAHSIYFWPERWLH